MASHAPDPSSSHAARRWSGSTRAPAYRPAGAVHRPRRPTEAPLYPVVQHHLETFLAEAQDADPMGWGVPRWVEHDFRDHASRGARLRCGILAHGFARVRCTDCGHDRLLAFSCKGRGVCPSCNARRMVEVAAHLTDEVIQGAEVGVMHACGHDNHVAILMGVAEVLAGMRATLPGTVKFIFQPAEEGLGGAVAMIADGVLESPRPGAIFGLHVWPSRVGSIGVRSGPQMSAAGNFSIIVKGVQTHGSSPWAGVDPIVVSAQILLGLQTIASRQVNVAYLPSVTTVGQIQGGNRSIIIPDSVVMVGTLRTFDDVMRADIAARIKRTAEDIATSAGARAIVSVEPGGMVTFNDTTLTQRMLPTLRRAAGAANVEEINPIMASEDFPAYTQEIPGIYFFLGVTPADRDPATVSANHSPYFFADEAALETGVRATAGLAVDYLRGTRR